MSRKGNCYDNAFMESLWSTLKLALVYRRDFTTHSQTRAAIFDYIEAFYNRQRRQSALDFLFPADFETKNNLQIPLFSLSILSRQAQSSTPESEFIPENDYPFFGPEP